jgi:hypothetical protein
MTMRRPRLSPLRLAAALAAASLAGVGVAYAAGMPLTSGSLWAGTQQLTKGTCTPGGGSDATIDEAHPAATGGGQAALTVSPQNNARLFALIQFSLGACGLPTTAGADSASLTLTVTAAPKSSHTIAVYPITSSWNAGTVTWNTAPTVGSTPTTTFSASTGTQTVTLTADVDAAIKSGSFYGWELVDTGSGNATTTIGATAGPAGQRPALSVGYAR